MMVQKILPTLINLSNSVSRQRIPGPNNKQQVTILNMPPALKYMNISTNKVKLILIKKKLKRTRLSFTKKNP